VSRERLVHVGGPVALLLAATLAVLLARGALGRDRSAPAPAARMHAASVPRHPQRRPAPARFYTIESGDTLGLVAARYGTTVERLRALNPGVDPTALAVGQRIRVQ
jgi:Tfp pilus assembly protein FimV